MIPHPLWDPTSPFPYFRSSSLPIVRSSRTIAGRRSSCFPAPQKGRAINSLRFETAQDGILILDADTGQITDVNPFLVEMLGYSHAELLGRQLWEIGPFKDIAAARAAFNELQSKGYIRYEDLPLEASDGRRLHVEFVSNVYWVDQQPCDPMQHPRHLGA